MDEIKSLLYKGETDEAIRLLTDYIRENPESDEAYYLLGNAWRKKGDNRLALNNYLEAIHRNPEPGKPCPKGLRHVDGYSGLLL